jgi:DNA-binding response OmpR family regulator
MRRLLIVDDDVAVRTSMGLYFEDVGWAVELAGDAELARSLMVTPFEAAILDLNLSSRGEQEGLELLRVARASSPRAAIILLTGAAPEGVGEVPADAVVRKPIRLGKLDELLASITKSR